MKMQVLAVTSAMALTGCAHWDSRAISYETAGDKLYVWKSDYSAGIGSANGACAQAATTMRANNTTADARANEGLLRLFNPGLATSQTNSEVLDLGMARNEAVTTTNVSNGQTAFASIAFFYLCQISLNNKLTGSEITRMWELTTSAVRAVGQTGNTTTTRADPIPLTNTGTNTSPPSPGTTVITTGTEGDTPRD